MMTLIQDLRYAVRSLVKTPTLTIAVILSLGLGIGANTTVFTWVQAVLLHPIPGAHDPDTLYVVNVKSREGRDRSWSYPNYRDFRDRRDARRLRGAGRHADEHRRGRSGRTRVWRTRLRQLLSGDGHSAGRSAGSSRVEDDRVPGGHPVAIISFAYWQRRFAGDRRDRRAGGRRSTTRR